MARKVNTYASKFSSVFIIIFVMIFLVNFCSSLQEENNILDKHLNTKSSLSDINDEEIQDKQCTQHLFLNASFAVVLALLWNAKQAMKLGTI